MPFSQFIAPSEEDAFLPLARTKQGRLFKKQILHKGKLLHPKTGEFIDVDEDMLDTIVKNFNDEVCDIVQFPLAGPRNEHSEAPERNAGEVIGLEKTDDKLYAYIDARDVSVAKKVTDRTILGASGLLHMNYLNSNTGQRVGPTLLHVTATNRPWVTGLEDYQEIAATHSSADDSSEIVLLTTKLADNPTDQQSGAEQEAQDLPVKERKMDRGELISKLKDEHGIDVAALQMQAQHSESAKKLIESVATALKGSGAVVELSNTDDVEISTDTLVEAIAEVGRKNTALETGINELKLSHEQMTKDMDEVNRERAELLVDGLIQEGRIAPIHRDHAITLKLTNEAEFDKFVPESAYLPLTQETGVAPVDQSNGMDIDKEIARIVEEGEKSGIPSLQKKS